MTIYALQSSVLAAAGGLAIAAGALVEIRRESDGGLQALWLDLGGTETAGNPVTADANGFFRVYLDRGDYRITVTALNVSITLRHWRVGPYDEDNVLEQLPGLIAAAVHPSIQRWVITGDAQPNNDASEGGWRSVRDHIAEHQADAHALIFAGDIAQRGNGDPSLWGGEDIRDIPYMVEEFRGFPFPRERIYAIPGNHDIDYDAGTAAQWTATFRAYLTHFERQFYHVLQGDVLFIFMGPMARNTAGNIADYVVAWCKELVRTHQDRAIIVTTHQPLQGIGIDGSDSVGGSQLESSRFLDWIGEPGYRVDAWFSGHSGVDLNNPSTVSHVVTQGCTFVGVDMGSGAAYDRSYVTLDIEAGSPVMTFQRWNVTLAEFPDPVSKTWTVTLPFPVALSTTPAFDGRFAYDPRHGIHACDLIVTGNVERVSSGSDYVALAEPRWLGHFICEDRANDDKAQNMGAGIILYTPGANTGSSENNQPNLNRAYGVGAGIASLAESNAETQFHSSLGLYASVDGRDTDTLRLVSRVTSTGRFDHLASSNRVPGTIKASIYSDGMIAAGGTVAETTPGNHRLSGKTATAGDAVLEVIQSTGGVSAIFYARGGGGSFSASGANACLRVAEAEATGRSISAGGTVNASGADYAEYFRVAPHLAGRVAKGDVLGLGADGRLTDRFADVVGPFLIKSTAPGLVGGDSWGGEEKICRDYGVAPVGEKPELREVPMPALPKYQPPAEGDSSALGSYHREFARDRAAIMEAWEAEVAAAGGEHSAAMAGYTARKAAFEAALESERQHWDRMALCGQVPCNVQATAADIGKWIVPVEGVGGGIDVEIVSDADLDFVAFRRAIGRVVAVADDGRAVALV